MSTLRQHKRGHTRFPPCIAAATPYVPLVVATATNSALPTLPREDRQRLTLFFQCGENLATLADKLNAAQNSGPKDSGPSPSQHSAPSTQHSDIDEFELQSWSTQPDIAAHIAHRRAEAAYRARKNALEELERILKETDNLIERRRAASAILRTLNRAGAPTGRSSSPTLDRPTRPRAIEVGSPDFDAPRTTLSTQSSALSTPTQSPRRPDPVSIEDAYAHKEGDIISPKTSLPDPARSPEDLLTLILAALKNPDHPDKATGPHTLFNLAGRIRKRTHAEFDNYVNNYLHSVIRGVWSYTSCEQLTCARRKTNIYDRHYVKASYFLTLSDSATRYLYITLELNSSGPLKDAWTLKHLFADRNKDLSFDRDTS
jgi:hypothetical protein